MAHPQARQAVGVVAEQLPFANAARIEGALGAAEQEELPIDVFLVELGRGAAPPRLLEVDLHIDSRDLPEHALPHQFRRAHQSWLTAALRADLYHLLAGAHGMIGELRIGKHRGHRLFAIDILAGAHSVGQHLRMGEVRRRDDDRIDLLPTEQFAIVGGFLNRGAVGGPGALSHGVAGRAVNVADAGDGDVLRAGLEQIGEVEAPAAAIADETDADAVIRGPGASGGGRRGSGYRTKESAAGGGHGMGLL